MPTIRKINKIELPKEGDKIYVHSSLYISHGLDNFVGGKCTISKIKVDYDLPEDSENRIMIGIKERPGYLYNYKLLLKEQDELKKEFGELKGHQDPIENGWDEGCGIYIDPKEKFKDLL